MAEKKRYNVHLSNGKRMTMVGTRPPTSQEIFDHAVDQGVDHLLVKREKPVEPPAPSAERSPLLSLASGAGIGGAMKAAPSFINVINKGAQLAAKGKVNLAGLPIGQRSLGALGVGAYVADPLVSKGDVETTAKRAAGAGALYGAGKVGQKVAEATARVTASPLISEMIRRNTGNARFGAVARGAEAVSRAAGPVGLAVTTATLPAHGPTADTPDGQRIQERVYREFADKVNKEAKRQVFPKDMPLDALMEAVRKYRGMQEEKRTPASEGFLRELMMRARGAERG
jgi:hypothetical protein